MSHDFTYLDQLNVNDLLDRANRGNWNGPEAHMIRALAVRLEDYLDFRDMVNNLQDELYDAGLSLDGWREEAQAVQRQLDRVRG